MVRLVFRPYTQLRRSICTSESLRPSIRISPDFGLTRHSSPSFGSIHLYSACSQRAGSIGNGGNAAARESSVFPRTDKRPFAFTAPIGLANPLTRIHVRLLGPCFKTGRSLRQPTRQGERQTATRRVARCTSPPQACRAQSRAPGADAGAKTRSRA